MDVFYEMCIRHHQVGRMQQTDRHESIFGAARNACLLTTTNLTSGGIQGLCQVVTICEYKGLLSQHPGLQSKISNLIYNFFVSLSDCP